MIALEGSEGARRIERETLLGLASEEASGAAMEYASEGPCVRFADAVGSVPADADHVTFHASDGYAVTLPLAQALANAVIVVPKEGSGRTGVRLVVPEGETRCLNVKAVTRVELREGPGKHTVQKSPHRMPPVKGWDEEV